MISWNEIKDKHHDYIHGLDDEPPVGQGWNGLIDELCVKIINYSKYCGCKGIVVKQIKEKFGGLRFYWELQEPDICEGAWEGISDLVRATEGKSYSTCEVCGKPGKPTKSGWIKVFCEEHAQMVKDGKSPWEDKS